MIENGPVERRYQTLKAIEQIHGDRVRYLNMGKLLDVPAGVFEVLRSDLLGELVLSGEVGAEFGYLFVRSADDGDVLRTLPECPCNGITHDWLRTVESEFGAGPFHS